MKLASLVALSCAMFFCPTAADAAGLSPSVEPTARISGTVVDQDEFSTTVRTPGGEMRTRVSQVPMNFKQSGKWRSVDTTLKPDARGVLHPAAVDGDVSIPKTLAQPVTIERGTRQLGFRLLGSQGSRSVKGANAKFASALPDVDISHDVHPSGTKETIILRTSDAQQSFRYELTADADLDAVRQGETIVLKDASDAGVFYISAPMAWDSAKPASYSDNIQLAIEKKADGRWILTVSPDLKWLNDPARRFPISIDPTYTYERFIGGATDCSLRGIAPNQNLCSNGSIELGQNSNALFKFNLDRIPAAATVYSSALWLYAFGSVERDASLSRIRTMTSDWDSTVTWNSRKAGTAWGTPGGDVSTTPNLIGQAASVGNAGDWYLWGVPLAAARGWVTGTIPNYGMQLSVEPGSPAESYFFISSDHANADWHPELDIGWYYEDTVAPPAPTGLRVEDANHGDRLAYLSFDEEEDLAQTGVSPSGVEYSEVQISKRGGPFSAWARVDDGTFLVTDVDEGDKVVLNVRSRDAAGNYSSVAQKEFATFYDGATPMLEMASDAFATQFAVSASEARSWLTIQDQTLDALSNLQGTTAMAGIAGTWFDNADRKAHIQLTPNANQTAIAAAVNETGIQSSVIYDQVTYSRGGLETKAEGINAALVDLVTAGKVWVVVKKDLSGISLMVQSTTATAHASRISSAAVAAGVPVATTAVAEDPGLFAAPQATGCDVLRIRGVDELPGDEAFAHYMRTCDGEFRGGVAIRRTDPNVAGAKPTYCTAGIPAHSKDRKKAYMITAGHCLSEEPPATRGTSWKNGEWTQVTGRTLGHAAKTIYAGEDAPAATDAGIIELEHLEDGEIVRPLVFESNKEDDRTRPKGERNRSRVLTKGLTPVADPFTYDQFERTRPFTPGRMLCLMGARTETLGLDGQTKRLSKAATTVKLGERCGPVLDRFVGSPLELAGDTAKVKTHQIAINTCRTRGGDSGGPWITETGKVAAINSGAITDYLGARSRQKLDQLQSATGVPIALCGGATHTYVDQSNNTVTKPIRGIAVASPIQEVELGLGVRVIRKKWKAPRPTGSGGSAGDLRISVVNSSASRQVNMYVWDAAGNWDSVYPAATAAPGLSGTRLRRLNDGEAMTDPVELRETTITGRSFGIGLCYVRGQGTATVELEITDPNGDSRNVTYELGAAGQTVLAGSSPSSANVPKPGTAFFNTQQWCPAPVVPSYAATCNASSGSQFSDNMLVSQASFTNGNLQQVNLEARDVSGRYPIPITRPVRYSVGQVTWSPDRRRAIVGSADGWWSHGIGVTAGRLKLRVPADPVSNSEAANVACSPDGSKLARALNSGVVEIVTLNSGATVTVANAGADLDKALSWSPDGTRLAFQSGLGSLSKIRLVNADGTGLTYLTGSSVNDDRFPRWAPDSQSLLFYAQQATGYPRLGYFAVAATNAAVCRRLSAVESRAITGFDLSTNGKTIGWSGQANYVYAFGAPEAGDLFTFDTVSRVQSKLQASTPDAVVWHLEAWGATLSPDAAWARPAGLAACS